MKEVELRVFASILSSYWNGKDLEIRTNTERTARVAVGDVLIINHTLKRRVKAIRWYRDFEKALAVEKPRRIFPGYGWNSDSILKALRTIYTPGAENRGVLVFELEDV